MEEEYKSLMEFVGAENAEEIMNMDRKGERANLYMTNKIKTTLNPMMLPTCTWNFCWNLTAKKGRIRKLSCASIWS